MLASILLPDFGGLVSWEGELTPSTVLKLSGGRTISLGALVTITNGDAWDWFDKSLFKHLAGQHEQKTHGGGGLHLKGEREEFWTKNGIKGRPTEEQQVQWKKTVASDLAKKMTSYGCTDQDMIDYHRKWVHSNSEGDYQEPTKKWDGKKPLSEIVTVGNPNMDGRSRFETMARFADMDTEEVTWEEAQKMLSESNKYFDKTGESHMQYFLLDDGGQQRINENVVARLVSEWAGSSNDESSVSLTLQDRAASLFKLEKTATWDIKEETAREMEFLKPHQNVYDAFLLAQYDSTQEYFKKANINEITLYRGIHLDPKPFVGGSLFETPEQFFNGFDTKFTSRPLSSWTTRLNQAELFSVVSATKGQRSYVLKKVFPVDKIISTPFTGNGCLREFEMVALGGEQEVFAIDGENASGIDDVA